MSHITFRRDQADRTGGIALICSTLISGRSPRCPETKRQAGHPPLQPAYSPQPSASSCRCPMAHTGRCSTQRRPAGAGQGRVRADPDRTAAVARQPLTPEKVELGKMLFFEPRLSASWFIGSTRATTWRPGAWTLSRHPSVMAGTGVDATRRRYQFGVQLRPVLGRARQGPDGAGPRSRPGRGRDEQQT